MCDLTVPPAPHWYKSQILACAPDKTLVYASKTDIVIVKQTGPEASTDVQFINGAHSNYVISVSLNKMWKDPHCHVVSAGEDGTLKLWDLQTLEKKKSNKVHKDNMQQVVGAVFAGDDRVVSVTTTGVVVVWNIHNGEYKTLSDLFSSKVNVTCVSSCPHVGWLVAFGLVNGAVVVADMRGNGKVLFNLRGHYHAVIGFAWCPVPINVFPKNPINRVKSREDVNKKDETKNQTNPWVNLIHADDSEATNEMPEMCHEQGDNFLLECEQLKKRILTGPEEVQAEIDTGLKTPKKDDKNCESLENDDRKTDKKCEIDTELQRHQEQSNRPLPVIFDPSGDFLDDFDPISETSNNTELKSEHEIKSKVKDISEKEQVRAIIKDKERLELRSEEEEPRMEYLLASAGRDGNIYIWRAGTDGRMQTFFGTLKKGKGKRRSSKNPSNTWISICWITPDRLLTTSMFGEVVSWPIPKPKESNKQNRVVSMEHTAIIFNLASPQKLWTACNWRDEAEDLSFWSWGHEGRLVNFDLNADQVLSSYSTVSAPVTCFEASTLDPTKLAIGLRDGNIRVWDLSFFEYRHIDMQKYHSKHMHKVSTIAWHPIREMVIAFGTEEGRIGFTELTGSKRNILFPHYFRLQVHKIQWGPLGGDIQNLGLYVVAEGTIVIYNVEKPNDDPKTLQLAQNLTVHRFAWKPDFNTLLINGKDGSLIILNKNLMASDTVYVSDKGLNEIMWHPDACNSNTDISFRCNWLATTTSKGVAVYDCSISPDSKESLLNKIVANFEGHLRPPHALAWCPFYGDRIVSTASDGLAHVWDVATKTLIATFADSYLSHNPGVVWNPNNSDLIIMGDKMIRIWSIKANGPKNDEEFYAARKKLAPHKKIELDEDKNKIKVDVSQMKNTKLNILPAFYTSSEENFCRQGIMMRSLAKGRQSGSEDWQDGALDPLQIFGTKKQVVPLLNAHYTQLKKEGRHVACEFISLFQGNIGDHIEEAIQGNRITPSLVTSAAMVSSQLFRKASEAYAKKLQEEPKSDPLEIAKYFLMCHKVEEAVNALCTGVKFKEALALVKCRFPDDSDFVTKVTENWASHCISIGNFEAATYCYLSVGQNENAARVLSRRSNKEFLKLSLELAGDNETLAEAIQFKLDKAEKDDLIGDLPDRIQAIMNLANDKNVKMTEQIDSEKLTCVIGDQTKGKEVKNNNCDDVDTSNMKVIIHSE